MCYSFPYEEVRYCFHKTFRHDKAIAYAQSAIGDYKKIMPEIKKKTELNIIGKDEFSE